MAASKDAKPSVEVVEVVHSGGEDQDADFLKEQDEALLNYRLTGVQGQYIDPSRDQEPDIAPELGLAPHPELPNARPPDNALGSDALDPEANPIVLSLEDKVERGKEAHDRIEEQSQARFEDEKAAAEAHNKAAKEPNTPDLVPVPEKALSAEEALNAYKFPDESPKAGNSDSRKKQ